MVDITTMPESSNLELQSVRRRLQSGELSLETWVEQLYSRLQRSGDPNVWIYIAPKVSLLARVKELLHAQKLRELRLFGVPFAVKDNIDVAGMPTSAGCRDFTYYPESSAQAVDALLRAGAICLGKTNLDQFATGLVGTRSPWGACQNVFDPQYLAGGSSSGSAVAVAAGLVTFALGTDTAGSGRVPAALNNIVGLKPTRGLISTHGVVPACQSLDCVSVFALCTSDAATVREIMLEGEGSASSAMHVPRAFRFGVPAELEWYGDQENAHLFEHTCTSLEALGGERLTIDWTPFRALGDLLYGAWVVERYLAVGSFVEHHPEACIPVTRDIILGARHYAGSDVFRAFHELEFLRAQCNRVLASIDVLLTPTVPRHFRLEDDARAPREVNDRLGIYTRFANFLDVPVLAVPAGFRSDGLPFGVSLVAAPHGDRSLDALGAALHAMNGAGMGRARTKAPPATMVDSPPQESVRLAVVGAHLRGMALHPELLACGARFVTATRTEAAYRMFALSGSQPSKPGLVRVAEGGQAIAIELYDLPFAGLGKLMARVSPPLAIGSLRTEEGEWVKGFICESIGALGGEDITSYGGFRAYMNRNAATPSRDQTRR